MEIDMHPQDDLPYFLCISKHDKTIWGGGETEIDACLDIVHNFVINRTSLKATNYKLVKTTYKVFEKYYHGELETFDGD